jgi:hypothetical protein
MVQLKGILEPDSHLISSPIFKWLPSYLCSHLFLPFENQSGFQMGLG